MSAPNRHAIPPSHIVFLHEKFEGQVKDRYLLDMADALRKRGHEITFYVSQIALDSATNEIKRKKHYNLIFSGNWLPSCFSTLRAIVMACRVAFFCLPEPACVITDVDAAALGVLSALTSCRLVHVCGAENYQPVRRKYLPGIPADICLRYADQFLVQSDGLADRFRGANPLVKNRVHVLPPCVDTGAWLVPMVHLERFMDAELDYEHELIFVCFAAYHPDSHIFEVVDGFGKMMKKMCPCERDHIHLVIAEHCSGQLDKEQIDYYKKMHNYINHCHYAGHVTFMIDVPICFKKSLINASLAVILPCSDDEYPTDVLVAMSAGKPIIAMNSGFAGQVLRHRESACLMNHPRRGKFADAMLKILTESKWRLDLADKANKLYFEHFHNYHFQHHVNAVISMLIKK